MPPGALIRKPIPTDDRPAIGPDLPLPEAAMAWEDKNEKERHERARAAHAAGCPDDISVY